MYSRDTGRGNSREGGGEGRLRRDELDAEAVGVDVGVDGEGVVPAAARASRVRQIIMINK